MGEANILCFEVWKALLYEQLFSFCFSQIINYKKWETACAKWDLLLLEL